MVFVALAACLLTFVTVMAFSQSSANVRWEYTTLSVDRLNDAGIQREANLLGLEGWELVAGSANVNFTSPRILIFKRRLP
jgi:hypothetical protein